MPAGRRRNIRPSIGAGSFIVAAESATTTAAVCSHEAEELDHRRFHQHTPTGTSTGADVRTNDVSPTATAGDKP